MIETFKILIKSGDTDYFCHVIGTRIHFNVYQSYNYIVIHEIYNL